MQKTLLQGYMAAPRYSAIRPVHLFYGIEQLDPTNDRRLVEFCFNIPQWVYYKGMSVLERRLLVREGLEGIVPEEVRMNPYRGEQAADWYLQFNYHYQHWRQQLLDATQGKQDHFLWKMFDREKIFELFQPVIHAHQKHGWLVSHILMRCMSLSFYMDYVQNIQRI